MGSLNSQSLDSRSMMDLVPKRIAGRSRRQCSCRLGPSLSSSRPDASAARRGSRSPLPFRSHPPTPGGGWRRRRGVRLVVIFERWRRRGRGGGLTCAWCPAPSSAACSGSTSCTASRPPTRHARSRPMSSAYRRFPAGSLSISLACRRGWRRGCGGTRRICSPRPRRRSSCRTRRSGRTKPSSYPTRDADIHVFPSCACSSLSC